MLSLSLTRGPDSGPLLSEKPHLYALRKMSSRRDPVGSQFRDPLERTPGGVSSSPAACWCSRTGSIRYEASPKAVYMGC
jgi:hypothetical protein